MAVAQRLLDETPEGSTSVVTGRPGAGVSTLLALVCTEAATSGSRAVLASWERPPAAWGEELKHASVGLPEIIGWDLDEFERAPMVDAAGPGAVIAIDYLQLIDHADGDASAAHALRNQAHDRRWRLFLGVMATRQLAELSTDVSAKRAARVTATRLGALGDGTNCTVILTGTDTRRRRITVTNGSTVRWSQALHGIPNV